MNNNYFDTPSTTNLKTDLKFVTLTTNRKDITLSGWIIPNKRTSISYPRKSGIQQQKHALPQTAG